MAYAEKVKSPKGTYWRGRYADGSRTLKDKPAYVSVRDEAGRVMRFRTKSEAAKAAEDAESDVRNNRVRDPKAGEVTFLRWSSTWYAGLDLSDNTMANRKRHLQHHLIPFFGDKTMAAIEAGGEALIREWESHEKKEGLQKNGREPAPLSMKAWRATLHVCLEDAVGKHIDANPAARKPGRGKRSGRKVTTLQGGEKAITDSLGILLVAERMSILTGRDDEFLMVVTAFFEALRFGELVGLEKPYVRPGDVRVEWQLAEIEGRLVHCPPKDDSQGVIVLPPFLRRLLLDHMRRVPPEPCPCHGREYVFRGYGVPKPKWNMPLRDLAVLSGIPEYTIRQALNGTRRVSDTTRRRVLEAAERFGFERGEIPERAAWHWRRSGFERFFTAAASGWFPPGDGAPRHPVSLKGEWPGARVLGPKPERRAEMCWTPVVEGLTPHSARHSIKTVMEWRRIPEIMSEAQMRHRVGGVSGIYRHTTAQMRDELADVMTQEWTSALDSRLELSAAYGSGGALSPVAVLDGLLRERLEARKLTIVPSGSPETESNVTLMAAKTRSDLGKRKHG